jgi:hypothetical protein
MLLLLLLAGLAVVLLIFAGLSNMAAANPHDASQSPSQMEIIYDRIQHSFYIYLCMYIEKIEKEKAPRAEKTEKQNKTRPCHYITFFSIHPPLFFFIFKYLKEKNVFLSISEKFANFKFEKKKRREF